MVEVRGAAALVPCLRRLAGFEKLLDVRVIIDFECFELQVLRMRRAARDHLVEIVIFEEDFAAPLEKVLVLPAYLDVSTLRPCRCFLYIPL